MDVTDARILKKLTRRRVDGISQGMETDCKVR